MFMFCSNQDSADRKTRPLPGFEIWYSIIHAVRAAASHGSTSPQFYFYFFVCTTESKQLAMTFWGMAIIHLHGTEQVTGLMHRSPLTPVQIEQ